MPRTINIPAKSFDVEIESFLHHKGQNVTVQLREVLYDSQGNAIPQMINVMRPELTKVISGADYVSLISANPSWGPNKPANTFREEDLWNFI